MMTALACNVLTNISSELSCNFSEIALVLVGLAWLGLLRVHLAGFG